MPNAYQILRFELQPKSVDSFLEKAKGAVSYLRDQAGYIGGSCFILVTKASKRKQDNALVIFEFNNQDNLEKAFLDFFDHSSKSSLEEQLGEFLPTVTTISVVNQSGLRPSEIKHGSFLSLSSRVSDPGMVNELINDLDIVFKEISVLPGIRGWSYGSQVDLPERVLGLAYWDSEERYRASLPKSATYELELFIKVQVQ